MAVKRRVIWMNDEHWAELGRVVKELQAKTDATGLPQKITPSLVILDSLDRGYFRRGVENAPVEVIDLGPTATPADADRAKERYGSRPFSPAPKPKGK